eukprot:scaffold12308_cov74-Cyclotella_meneghiniana.AAC.27
MDWAVDYLKNHVRYSGRNRPADDNILSFALLLACDVIGASIGASIRSFVAWTWTSTMPLITDMMVAEDETRGKQEKSRQRSGSEISPQRDASISNRIASNTKRKQQHLQLDITDDIVVQPTIYSVNGLRNKGQTCYANSVFQAIAALPSFCMYLQQLQSITGTNLGHELNQTIQYINGHEISSRSKKRHLNSLFGSVSSSSTPIKYGDPCKVLDIVARHHSQFRSRNGMFVGTSEQQDAHEFFIALMDVLSTEDNKNKHSILNPDIPKSTTFSSDDKHYDSSKIINPTSSDFDRINKHHQEEKKHEGYFDICMYKRKTDSFTNDNKPLQSNTNISCSSPFDGWLGSTIKCNSCHHIRPIRSNPFVALSISLANDRPTDTIENCIEGEYGGFATAEQVSDVLCLSCAIKEKLNVLEEEELLLKGAISNIKRRASTKTSKSTNTADDLVELVKEVGKLRAAANQLKSLDADADEVNLIDTDKFPSEEIQLIQIDSSASSKLQPIRVEAWKANLIMRQPKILCIHIQRRHFDYKSGQMMKFRGHVAFSEIMALSDFYSFDQQKHKDRMGSKILYKLMSVIEHHGGAFGGHYQTYRRSSWNQGSNTWVLVSDMSVSSMTWNAVKKCQAYMLFYVAL